MVSDFAKQNCIEPSVLVTGSSGFIGSHLVEALKAQGSQVTLLDQASSSLESLRRVPWLRPTSTQQGSITDFATCLRATKNIDTVFHLAALVSVPESMENPLLCHEVNVQGTANMLEACRRNGVKRFVFSSSSAVYGPVEGPAHEQLPCNPQSPYGYSKLLGELLCKEYAQLHGVGTVCLRYFNVYGERQNPHGSYAAAVAKISHALAHNQPIEIYGDGLQTRDFVPVEQVVRANIALAQLPFEQMNGQAFNIGSGQAITLLDLVAQLRTKFPYSTSEIQFYPTRPGDIKHSTADCAKFQTIVFTPPHLR